MKAIGRALVFAIPFLAAGPVAAEEWLQGTYINQDEDSLMDEATFCEDGKVYAGMAPRTYKMETRDGKPVVVLSSNGTFTFTVSDDEQMLTPADDFTKEWFTKTGLKKDPARDDTCNW